MTQGRRSQPRGGRKPPGDRPGRGARPESDGRASEPRGERQVGGAPGPTSVHDPGPARAVAVRANRRRAALLCAGAGVVVGLVIGVAVGLAVDLVGGLVGAVVAALGVGMTLRWTSAALALRLLGAVPLAPGAQPRLENLVDGLGATFGLRPPRLAALQEHIPNACAVGNGRDQHWLVVTTGLLERLDLVELEGVVAHELAHLRQGDDVVAAAAMVVLAPWTWLRGDDRLLHRALGVGREFRADDLAVSMVRYPPGLQRALEEMPRSAPASSPVFTGKRLLLSRWVWVSPPVGLARETPSGLDPEGRLDDRLDAPEVRAAALSQR